MLDKDDVYHFFEQGQTVKQHFYLQVLRGLCDAVQH